MAQAILLLAMAGLLCTSVLASLEEGDLGIGVWQMDYDTVYEDYRIYAGSGTELAGKVNGVVLTAQECLDACWTEQGERIWYDFKGIYVAAEACMCVHEGEGGCVDANGCALARWYGWDAMRAQCVALDQDCENWGECCSNVCKDSVCAECLTNNEDCASSAQCCDGYVCAKTGVQSWKCKDDSWGSTCKWYGQSCTNSNQCCGTYSCTNKCQ